MRLWKLQIMVMLMIGTSQAAFSADRRPICREPSVVDEMAREVRMQNYYSYVDPRLVTEEITGDPQIVRCQVCIQSSPYDQLRFGEMPIRHCLAHGFEVRALLNGFVVRDLR